MEDDMDEMGRSHDLWPLYRHLEPHLSAFEPEAVHAFVGGPWRRLPAFLAAHDRDYERIPCRLPQTAFVELDGAAAERLKLERHYAVRFRWNGSELQVYYSEPAVLQKGRAYVCGPSEAVADLARELSAWSLGRSRVRVYGGGDWMRAEGEREAIPEVGFHELYLDESLERELRGAVDLVYESTLLPELGLPRRRGLLLVGPPGNGKTHFIRALIAHYRDTAVFYLTRSERGLLGHSLDCLMDDAMERLRRGDRCLIVLEEIEAFMAPPDERSAFLNALDGALGAVPEGGALLVVGTTNHPEQLDAAVLQRPSRFDRVFVFRPPDAALRRRYLRDRTELDETTLEEIVRRTDGLSFAYLQEVVISARYAAAFEGGEPTVQHYREAAARLTAQRREGERLDATSMATHERPGFRADDDR